MTKNCTSEKRACKSSYEYRQGDLLNLLKKHSKSALPQENVSFSGQTEDICSLFSDQRNVETSETTEDKQRASFNDENFASRQRLAAGLRKARLVETKHQTGKKANESEALRSLLSDLKVPAGSKHYRNSTSDGILSPEDVLDAKGRSEPNVSGYTTKAKKYVTIEQQKEVTRRSIFVGNIPLDTTKTNLRQILRLTKAQVESVRFRSQPVDPKYNKQRAWAASSGKFTGNCPIKNAYVVLSHEEDVKNILASATPYIAPPGHTLRVTSVPFQRRTFSLYPKKSTVFVGNLYVKVTEEDIRRAFEENVGPVRNVRIIRDPTVYISKGFAFVELADCIHLPKALRVMNGFILRGRPLNVTKAMGEHEAKQADQARKDMIQRKIERKRRQKLKEKSNKSKKHKESGQAAKKFKTTRNNLIKKDPHEVKRTKTPQ